MSESLYRDLWTQNLHWAHFLRYFHYSRTQGSGSATLSIQGTRWHWGALQACDYLEVAARWHPYSRREEASLLEQPRFRIAASLGNSLWKLRGSSCWSRGLTASWFCSYVQRHISLFGINYGPHQWEDNSGIQRTRGGRVGSWWAGETRGIKWNQEGKQERIRGDKQRDGASDDWLLRGAVRNLGWIIICKHERSVKAHRG